MPKNICLIAKKSPRTLKSQLANKKQKNKYKYIKKFQFLDFFYNMDIYFKSILLTSHKTFKFKIRINKSIFSFIARFGWLFFGHYILRSAYAHFSQNGDIPKSEFGSMQRVGREPFEG